MVGLHPSVASAGSLRTLFPGSTTLGSSSASMRDNLRTPRSIRTVGHGVSPLPAVANTTTSSPSRTSGGLGPK